MNERALRAAIAVLALAGIGITSYLVYERYTGGTLICTTGGCETVQHSRYAKIAGVPVALIGLLGYIGLLVTALLDSDLARAAGVALSLAAALLGAYLLVIQATVIHAYCTWCLASDLLVLLIAALALARAYAGGRAAPSTA